MMEPRESMIEDVWQYLPARKYFAGRACVAEMVERIIAAWQPSRLIPSDKGVDASHVAAEINEQVSSQYGTIWLIVFQALISIAIQYLIELWFASVVARSTIVSWCGDLRDE